MTAPTLVNYLTVKSGETLPPPAPLYDYLLAAGGVYLRAEREGLRVCQRIAECPVRGLAAIEPVLQFTLPRVPEVLTLRMLRMAQAERDAAGRPIEVMYHLCWEDGKWCLVKPNQIQSRSAVDPVEPFAGTSYATYLIEVHSHHELPIHAFSNTDNASEGSTFRLFGLLSDIFAAPRLNLRLNAYGYRWDMPAALAFELPVELADGLEGEPDDEALNTLAMATLTGRRPWR
jgi:hypothetical protein